MIIVRHRFGMFKMIEFELTTLEQEPIEKITHQLDAGVSYELDNLIDRISTL